MARPVDSEHLHKNVNRGCNFDHPLLACLVASDVLPLSVCWVCVVATLKAVATLESPVPHVSGRLREPAAVGKSCSNPVRPMVPVVVDVECKRCLAFGGGGSCGGPATLKYVSGMVTGAMLLCPQFFDEMMQNP